MKFLLGGKKIFFSGKEEVPIESTLIKLILVVWTNIEED